MHEIKKFAARLADQLGLDEVGPEMRPYLDAAAEFARAQLAHLATTAGGGHVGPGPASMVHTAGLALAASRWAYSKGSVLGDAQLLAQGARLGDQSRQALLTAFELCAREAKARAGEARPVDLGTLLGGEGSTP